MSVISIRDARWRGLRRRALICCAAAPLLLAACGGGAAPTAVPTSVPSAAPSAVPTRATSVLSAPSAVPAATPGGTATATRVAATVTRAASPGATPTGGAMDVPSVATFAIAALASQLNLPPEQIAVTRVTKEEWPNSSLGCPEPGRAYLQVITPGYRLILTAGGKDYEYHTNETNMIVRCSP